MRVYISVVFSLLFFYATSICHAQTAAELEEIVKNKKDAINGVAFSPTGDRIAVSMRNGQGGQLIIFSLRDCQEEKRFNYKNLIPSVIISSFDAGSVWGAQVNILKKWDIINGSEQYSIKISEKEPIEGVIQSDDGKYIAAWSRTTAGLLRIESDGKVVPLWKEDTPFPISSIVIDSQSGYFFISGFDGSLVKRNFYGGILNSFSLDYPIYSLAIDPNDKQMMIATGSQLLRFDIDKTVFSRVSTMPTTDVAFSGDFKAVAVVGNNNYVLYSYPIMKVEHAETITGNKIQMMHNGSSVVYDSNILRFFDRNKLRKVGSIHIFDTTSGFVSHKLDYFGNEFFRTFILNGLVAGVAPYAAKSRPPSISACIPFKEMLDGVYRPTVADVGTVAATTTVKTPTAPKTPQRNNVSSPKVPTTPSQSTAATKPTVANATTPSNVTIPTTPTKPSQPQAVPTPAKPKIENMKAPVLAPGANVPAWVVNPEKQPSYSAVQSGNDISVALKEAKNKIHDSIARAIMKKMLDKPAVKDVLSVDTKKRLLWNVGDKTGKLAMDYVIQTDMWVSPQGLYYVLANVDSNSVEQLYEPIFEEEVSKLQTYGDEEYMNQ